MDTKVAGRSISNLNSIEQLFEVDWSVFVKPIDPPIDERLLHAAFSRTINCWLSFAFLLQIDKSKLKLPNGRHRKASKVPPELKYRYFTHAELESIYLLVLMDFFSTSGKNRLTRFQKFIEQIMTINFVGDLSAVFTIVDSNFENGGGLAFDKKIYRCRDFLLQNGFSHIRVDLVSGQIRLCPITKEFDSRAGLYMNQQPQSDSVSVEEEQSWNNKFGKEDRGFYEIPLDRRVSELHEQLSGRPQSEFLALKKMVAANTPKHGIIVLPRSLSSLLMEEGFASLLKIQN